MKNYPQAGHKGNDYENIHVYQLSPGDITTGGATILSKPTAGIRTPKGKIEVYLQYPNGTKKVQLWGKHTVIGIKRKDTPIPDQISIKEQVKKYLFKSVKKSIKENVVTGGGAPAISNPVTQGGTGEAHQGGKRILVKKTFKEDFKKALKNNPKFKKKKINESSFTVPVEKLVSWASKYVLHSTVPPYPEIQRYAEENNLTPAEMKNMAKFYLSNIQMFGPKAAEYADVLKDLIASIDEIVYSKDLKLEKNPIKEIRFNQFTKQTKTRSPRESYHVAIKEIYKKMKEVKKIMEFTSKMKVELKGQVKNKLYERTNKALRSLRKELAELYKTYKQIK